MHYRLELIMGEGVPPEEFAAFLDALGEVSIFWRNYAGTQGGEKWRRELRPGRAEAWVCEYDMEAWAQEGTPLFLALTALANQPYATTWQFLGPAATHPEVGLRLLRSVPGGWTEIYRLP